MIQSMACNRLLYPHAWYSRLVGNYGRLWFPHEFGHLWLCSCRFSLSFIYTPCILMRLVYRVYRVRIERPNEYVVCIVALYCAVPWVVTRLLTLAPLRFVFRLLYSLYSLWSVVAGRLIVSRCLPCSDMIALCIAYMWAVNYYRERASVRLCVLCIGVPSYVGSSVCMNWAIRCIRICKL